MSDVPSTQDLRIDRLRGIFAMLVMLGHSMDISGEYAGQHSLLDMGFSIIRPLRGFLGLLWVVGFIVLSGYCIARASRVANGRFDGRGYALMRITRIYPILLFVTVFAAAVEFPLLGSADRTKFWNWGVSWENFFVQALGVSGFSQTFGALAPTYTLSFELFYYLIWGIALVLCAGRRRMALITLIPIGICLYVFGRNFLTTEQGYASNVMFCLIMQFAWLGGCAGWIFREQLDALGRRIPPSLAWLLLLGVSTGIAILQNTGSATPPWGRHDVATVALYLLLTISFLILISSYTVWPDPRHHGWLDRWLGEISYPLFMVHGPTIVLAGYLISRWNLALPFTLHLAALVLPSIVLAQMLVVFVERPVMAWRRRARSAVRTPSDHVISPG